MIAPIVTRWSKHSLVVRAAESNPEDVESDVEASNVEASNADEQKRPPRKPIVKLGDIMGVSI